MKSSLTKAATEELLGQLCVKLGFCLPPVVQKRIINNPPTQVERFTDVVWRAEGFDPEFIGDQRLYAAVRCLVAEAFEKAIEDASSNQSV